MELVNTQVSLKNTRTIKQIKRAVSEGNTNRELHEIAKQTTNYQLDIK